MLVVICSDPLVQRSGPARLGGGGVREGARGVIVRILAITQATHPCLITSCLGTIFTIFFFTIFGQFWDVC